MRIPACFRRPAPPAAAGARPARRTSHPACEVFGHRLDPEALHYYALEFCVRCTRELDYGERTPATRAAARLRLVWLHMVADVKALGDWLTCPACGMHFGRHDLTRDHLPF